MTSDAVDQRMLERGPFGEESCESEKKVFRDRYSDYFFDHAPFIDEAMERRTYLIIGRRGSGKTSLANYFLFQKMIPGMSGIDVDEPSIYNDVFAELATMSSIRSDDAIVERLVRVWDYLVWKLLFEKFRDDDPKIRKLASAQSERRTPASLLKSFLKGVIEKYVSDGGGELLDCLNRLTNDDAFREAKEKVLMRCRKRPVIIAIDSQERYEFQNEALMQCTAALVQFGAIFNQEYSYDGLHIKIFMSAEVFPHLSERWVTNTTKYVRDEIYMSWRPKDLARLVTWRFFKYLKERGEINGLSADINWESFKEVHQNYWEPYFGGAIENGRGIKEGTFSYVLRHTQLRPRQLVRLCNTIARVAHRSGGFPQFSRADILGATGRAEVKLATEVVNSYEKAYPNAAQILDALNGMPAVFEGRLLDKLAPRSASAWPNGGYSPQGFRQLVAELGVVGRVRKDNGAVIEADFEYAMEERLVLPSDAQLVVHPMFYQKLNIRRERPAVVLPFPDHPDFAFA